MTTRLSPLSFPPAIWVICLALFLNVSPVATAEYLGPVFPGEQVADARLNEPLPLPKPNPLLQRSGGRQVVFEDIDPVDSVVSQDFRSVEEFEIQLARDAHQNRVLSRRPLVNGNIIFIDDDEYMQGGMWHRTAGCGGEAIGSCHFEAGPYFSGPIPITFGMGLFDNLTLFAETTTFKTELNNGAGSYGLGQGINWSLPVTPQGTVTAQYGIRAVQGDLFSQSVRHQTFMTAGVFKRFALTPVQGGVAFDWLHDHSVFGTVNVRQMRCELSARSARNVEYGFLGSFDVFRDRPVMQNIERLDRSFVEFATVDVHDYYLLFVRKHLNAGGQIELRCGTTERGDVIMSALGEAAISDRLAVNGGISMLAPTDGQNARGNYRESWSMSLGIVLYFRGGAMSRPANLYRPMFDVAGNNSLFTRISGR